MSQGLFFTLLYVVTALVMLFQLRSLVQSSSADYYNKLVQGLVTLTNPLVNIPVWRTMRMGSFFIAGMVVALIISAVFWVLSALFLLQMPIFYSLIATIFLFIKALGYLVIGLLLAQALTSWLPATRELSYLFGEVTRPIVAPVQRIIPPIGMIDISLMIVLIALYALNGLMYKVLAHTNLDLLILWRII